REAICSYAATSSGPPITPNVSVCGGSWDGSAGGLDGGALELGAPWALWALWALSSVWAEELGASPGGRPAAAAGSARRTARGARRARRRPRALVSSSAATAETLVGAANDEESRQCAGPGAPHGAWPLVAAEVGTRGCRGPTHWRPL